MPPRFPRPGRSPIRGALVASLSAMILLWLITGYELLRNQSDVQQQVAGVHAASVRGEETFSAIRTSVLLGSIYLRDALVDSADTRPYYREELRRIRREIEQRVRASNQIADRPMEVAEWRQLQDGLDAYWATLDLFLGPGAPRTYVQGTGVLRRQVVPARENVLRIVDRLADLQRLAQREREAAAARLDEAVRQRFLLIGGITLLAATALAVFVVRHVGGLEREIERRRLAESENRRDLERLSARLVDAQEQERRTIARELHDEVGQALTAIKMEMGIALRGADGNPRVRTSIEEARTIAERTLQCVRDLSQLLHPSTLDDFGLPETVAAYVRSFAKRTGIHAEVATVGLEQRLPPGVETATYRIVQEALSNVARHSGAAACAIDIRREGDTLHVTIDDDGHGVRSVADGRVPRGLGIIGMRERVQSLAGTFTIESRPGGGTRIAAIVPLAHHARALPDALALG